ncbi:hypothetical protein JW935_25640 [candidate division KSB1 bacterium]|nr:hypothetical protein [candidate division KSB1 bacterium]
MKKWLQKLFFYKVVRLKAEQSAYSGPADQLYGRLNSLVFESAVRRFGPFFTDKVMSRILNQQPNESEFFETLTGTFRRIAFAGALTVVLLCIYNMITSDSYTMAGLLALPQWSLEEVMAPSYTALLEGSL